jgi:hypothetical protein
MRRSKLQSPSSVARGSPKSPDFFPGHRGTQWKINRLRVSDRKSSTLFGEALAHAGGEEDEDFLGRAHPG